MSITKGEECVRERRTTKNKRKERQTNNLQHSTPLLPPHTFVSWLLAVLIHTVMWHFTGGLGTWPLHAQCPHPLCVCVCVSGHANISSCQNRQCWTFHVQLGAQWMGIRSSRVEWAQSTNFLLFLTVFLVFRARSTHQVLPGGGWLSWAGAGRCPQGGGCGEAWHRALRPSSVRGASSRHACCFH